MQKISRIFSKASEPSAAYTSLPICLVRGLLFALCFCNELEYLRVFSFGLLFVDVMFSFLLVKRQESLSKGSCLIVSGLILHTLYHLFVNGPSPWGFVSVFLCALVVSPKLYFDPAMKIAFLVGLTSVCLGTLLASFFGLTMIGKGMLVFLICTNTAAINLLIATEKMSTMIKLTGVFVTTFLTFCVLVFNSASIGLISLCMIACVSFLCIFLRSTRATELFVGIFAMLVPIAILFSYDVLLKLDFRIFIDFVLRAMLIGQVEFKFLGLGNDFVSVNAFGTFDRVTHSVFGSAFQVYGIFALPFLLAFGGFPKFQGRLQVYFLIAMSPFLFFSSVAKLVVIHYVYLFLQRDARTDLERRSS